MRYIKSYLRKFNESKSMLDTNTIGDILLEISDIGYVCNVNSSWWTDGSSNGIRITIMGKNGNPYIYASDVKEVIGRLDDYLESEGYKPSDESHHYLLSKYEEIGQNSGLRLIYFQ